MPVFSVIIPAYNSERYITSALDSVRCQTYKDYEIIVINDGSTDNTPKIVSSYIEKYKDSCPIKMFHQENKGVGGARNTGTNNADGRYIALLDQDDIWYPTLDVSVNIVNYI